MPRKQVQRVVKQEIGAQWSRTNLHGVVLKECLVPPIRMRFVDTRDQDVEVWVVLHECPPTGPGYAVVFDEQSGSFGLAQFANGYAPLLIGLHGGFFAALDAM